MEVTVQDEESGRELTREDIESRLEELNEDNVYLPPPLKREKKNLEELLVKLNKKEETMNERENEEKEEEENVRNRKQENEFDQIQQEKKRIMENNKLLKDPEILSPEKHPRETSMQVFQIPTYRRKNELISKLEATQISISSRT